MKIKYFKNYSNMQDCYVNNDEKKEYDFFNIVYLSKNHVGVFANDESSNYPNGRLDGFYRFINFDKKDFGILKELAFDKNRKEALTLLRKIHEKNPEGNPIIARIEGDKENFDSEKNWENYKKSEPILK